MSGLIVLAVFAVAGGTAVWLIRRRPPQPGSAVWHRQADPAASLTWKVNDQLVTLGHDVAWEVTDHETATGTCQVCERAAVISGTTVDVGTFDRGDGGLLPCLATIRPYQPGEAHP